VSLSGWCYEYAESILWHWVAHVKDRQIRVRSPRNGKVRQGRTRLTLRFICLHRTAYRYFRSELSKYAQSRKVLRICATLRNDYCNIEFDLLVHWNAFGFASVHCSWPHWMIRGSHFHVKPWNPRSHVFRLFNREVRQRRHWSLRTVREHVVTSYQVKRTLTALGEIAWLTIASLCHSLFIQSLVSWGSLWRANILIMIIPVPFRQLFEEKIDKMQFC
jgi:hypothetical protein